MSMDAIREALNETFAVIVHGDEKHGLNEWRHVPPLVREGRIQKHIEALRRHSFRRANGVIREQESGRRHLAHVAARALIALQLEIDKDAHAATRT